MLTSPQLRVFTACFLGWWCTDTRAPISISPSRSAVFLFFWSWFLPWPSTNITKRMANTQTLVNIFLFTNVILAGHGYLHNMVLYAKNIISRLLKALVERITPIIDNPGHLPHTDYSAVKANTVLVFGLMSKHSDALVKRWPRLNISITALP